MTLLEPAESLLKDLYQHYQRTGRLQAQLNFSDDPEEKSRQHVNVEQLVLAGYVQKAASAAGFVVLKLTKAGIDYFESPSVAPQPQSSVFNFHFSGDVNNSIFGNQENATINIHSELDNIEKLIAQIDGPDRSLLSTLPNELSKLQESKEVQEGCLAKFNRVLTKYPKLFDSVGSVLTKFVLGLFS